MVSERREDQRSDERWLHKDRADRCRDAHAVLRGDEQGGYGDKPGGDADGKKREAYVYVYGESSVDR